MLLSQIACHTFLCLYQPRPTWNFLIETRDMPKELGLFYIVFLTVPLYIQWEQFNIVQVTLPTPYNRVNSSFMLVLKRLHPNLLNIVISLTSRVIIGDNPTRIKTIQTTFKANFLISTLKETGTLWSQLTLPYQNIISLRLFTITLVMSQLPGKKMVRKGLMKGLPTNLPDLK